MTDVKKEQEQQSTNYIGTDKAVQTREISNENDTSSDKQSLKKLTRSLTEMSIECGTVPTRAENKENTITIDDIGDMSIDKKGIVQVKVRTVFELPETEVLVNEFPCYLIRLVTIPGWMYVTNNHICFYASLPGKKKGPYKAGYLTKKNHITSPRTYRYYFELRNHVLSWYSSAETKYSPLNSIDLKYVVKIEPSRLKKYGIRLSTVNSHHYTLIADTELSQKEWMDELRKGVFVAQHSGNSVRIVLPFTKIAVVEKPSVFQFANNIKIRFVDDNTDGEDYYFAFFPDIELAYNEITNLWKSHVSTTTTTDVKKPRPQSIPAVNKINYTSINFPNFDSFLENISPAALPTLLMGKLLNVTGLFQNSNNNNNKASSPEDEEEDEDDDIFSDGTDYEIQDTNPQQKSGLFSSLKKHNNKKDPQKRLSRTSIFFHWPTPEPIEEASSSSPSSSDGIASSPEESSTKPPVSFNSLTRFPRVVSDAFKNPASTQTQSDDNSKRRRSSSLSMLKNTFYRNSRKDTSGSELDIADTAIHSNQSGDVSLTSTPEMTKNRSSSIGSMLLSGGSKTWHKLTPSNDSNTNPHENYRHPKGPIWMNTKMMKDLQYLKEQNQPTDTTLLEEGYVTDEEDAADQTSILSQEQRMMNEHLNANFPMLLKTEHVEAAFKASFWRTIPYPGKIYVTDKYFCFHSKILAGQQKLIVPWSDVIQANKLKSKSYYLVHGMTLIISHMTDPLYFDFSSIEIRDHCFNACQLKYENKAILDTSSVYSKESRPGALSMSSIILDRSEHIEPPRDFDGPPLLSTSTSTSTEIIKKLNRPDKSLHFTCLTIGSRGDVQPYVALCKELQKDGHRCRIATHPEYENWVTGHGIEFRSVGGDPETVYR
ncbi:hypothetical protein BD770DRAFT_204796 [Pilaira anomala]|nr:hypothetical protein BD770DRAFT_204796 [Pilaira anomala]